MQESWQTQQVNPKVVSDQVDDEVTICDICGDAGREDLLAICSKCTDGAEHIYCMRVPLEKVPEDDWICEECTMRSKCQKSRNPVYHESWSSSKGRIIRMSVKSPGSSKPCFNSLHHTNLLCKNYGNVKATKDITSELQISCRSQEKAKRTIGIELNKKRRALETRATFFRASKPSNQSLISREPPFKKLGKEKLKAAQSECSVKQSCDGSQEKSKLASCLVDELLKLGTQTEITHDKCSLLKSGSSKTGNLKFKGQLTNGDVLQKRKVERNLAFHDNRKEKQLGLASKSVPFNSVSSMKLNATYSEVILANPYRPVVFNNSSFVEETKTTTAKYAFELCYPEESENKTISRDETIFSGSNCCRLDVVQSCGQLDCRLQPNSLNAHKDLNCLNEEKKNESRQAERPTKAATAMELHESCTDLGYGERSQFEAPILYENFFIPKSDYIWLGKFQIHRRREGIAITCVGIQAKLSTYASQKVLEVVDRLPDIIVLEELPRLKMWPSQCMESQVTEENIALYFFAKDLYSYTTYRGLMEYMTKNDLALKGNLDGDELLIFPSSVLPEKSQRWNKLLFLWGVFRGCKFNNPTNTPLSNSQKRENRAIVSSCALDLNVYPEDGNDVVRVPEIGEFETIGTSSPRDRILVGRDSYNSTCSEPSQSLDGEKKTLKSALDLDISLQPESATPKDGPWLSLANMDGKPNKDVQGKLPMEEKNNVNNVEQHGKLPIEDQNNAGNDEPSFLSLVSPTINEENLDLLHWQAAETLFFLSMRLRKI